MTPASVPGGASGGGAQSREAGGTEPRDHPGRMDSRALKGMNVRSRVGGSPDESIEFHSV